ncbi:hypothetical protein [Metabacillus fastidiosus]|uniref:hypothetical protein n=1 Tax=Metabacillus fastidiosus TaxID=1458 RepID=UPI003D273F8C
MEKKTANINVKITGTLRKRFDHALAHEGLTISQFIVKVISDFCEKVEEKQMKIAELHKNEKER